MPKFAKLPEARTFGDTIADGCTLNTSLTQRGITPLSGGVLRIFPWRNTMSSASFRFGFRVGTALRDCIRAVNQKPKPATVHVVTAQCRVMPEPVMTHDECENYCSVPAIVRRKGINLHDWYEANTQEAQTKPVKKPRKPRASTAPTTPQKQDAEPAVKGHVPGSLDQLIA
ncbi:hypothetical protein ALP74_100468 [Pseudomonas coronafaciens pv. garcae]|uniref:Transposase n=2 Tax=Pseudomonas syringae group TaxID=136849 RepID=A0AB37QHV4_9PSED|nr:hypothetical protein ALP74_100468 [Pseudomonas coronafaciens pv. garcae]